MDTDVLKLFQWENSLEAIKQLENLLLCSVCKAIAEDAKCLGRCEHFFCSKCVSSIKDGICPQCSIPAPPCEMQPDRIIANLVSSAKDLRHLLNGGEINWVEQGIEAPGEPCTPKNQIRTLEPDEDLIFKPNNSGVLNKSLTNNVSLSRNSKSGQTKAKKELNVSKRKEKVKVTPKGKGTKYAYGNKVCADTSVSNSTMKKASELKVVPITPEGKKLPQLTNLSALGMSPGGPSINKRNAKGETSLHIACIKGDIEKVVSLLSEGANPNSKDNAGWTPLHEACSHGFYNIAELLLRHGAFVDVPGGDSEENPLHDAITQGQIELVELLRCWGASDTARNLHGQTPRSLASLCVGSAELHAALDTPADTSLKKPQFMPPYLERMVLLGSGLSTQQTKSLDQLAKMLRVRVVFDFSQEVTHLVVNCTADKVVSQKTPQYMMGLASGKWILSHTWMVECIAQGKVLSPEEYEVFGSKDGYDRDAPSRARISSSKMHPGLLRGCHIYLWGSFREPYHNKKTLETLIKAGDGVVLAREPDPEAPENVHFVPYHAGLGSVLYNCTYIILYQEGPVEPQIKYNMDHIKTLPVSWFMNCIECFQLLNPVK